MAFNLPEIIYITTTTVGFFILSCIFYFNVNLISCTAGQPNDISNPLVGAINEFSFQIAEKLKTKDDYFFSPLSLYIALAMLERGAGGQTKYQLQQVLNYKSGGITLKEIVNNLYMIISLYDKTQENYDLLLANGMFVQESSPINKRYEAYLERFFHANVKNVNFECEITTEEINSWVSNKTRNMIPNLFSEPLDPSTIFVLLNAVFFKGNWKHPFPEDKTFDHWIQEGVNRRKVKMMKLEETLFDYYGDVQTGTKFLKLPYEGNEIAMLLSLPSVLVEHPNFKNDDELRQIIQNMRNLLFNEVLIPKFRLQYSNKMNGLLTDLGMKDAFITNVANFTHIREANDLLLSSVLHEAVIEVDEKGSKASAVVADIAHSKSMPSTFIAKPPFTFYIIDERNGLILFSGKLTNP